MIQAIEMRAKDLEFVESAAPMLISSDTADIEGLERDLLASGRYVGQAELAVLVQDWAETFGGAVARNGSVLEVRGNEELAGHVQALVRTGERRASEVDETCALLRSEQIIYLSLDQERSRTTGLPLLTATHPLTRAALGTPGHRQGRLTLLEMDPETAGLPEGTYLSLLAVVSWNGIRPLHEVWSSSINLVDQSDTGDSLGLAIMSASHLRKVVGTLHPLAGRRGLRILLVGPTDAYVRHVSEIIQPLNEGGLIRLTHLEQLFGDTTLVRGQWGGGIDGRYSDVDAKARGLAEQAARIARANSLITEGQGSALPNIKVIYDLILFWVVPFDRIRWWTGRLTQILNRGQPGEYPSVRIFFAARPDWTWAAARLPATCWCSRPGWLPTGGVTPQR